MNRGTLKKLYREAIINVFGCGDKELDKEILAAVKKDIHLGGKDPGGWGDHAILSVYCENGIPNATDINDFAWMGFAEGGVTYNTDKWSKIDAIVNLYLEATNAGFGVFHEPVNGAVVNIYAVR